MSALVMAGCIGLTGCSDFLDAENKSNVESEKYFMSISAIVIYLL